MRFLIGTMAILVSGADLAAAVLGEVRTTDGRRHRGEIILKDGCIQVTDEGDKVTRIVPGELQYLRCQAVSQKNGSAKKPKVDAGTGNGLKGAYYANPRFEGKSRERVDATVHFDWRSGSAMSGLSGDQFSIRWTGEVEAPVSGKYDFYIVTDDGGRLWIGDRLLIDQWRDQAATEGRAEIELEAGKRYPLKMDYYENGGDAVAKLLWRVPGREKEMIPSGRLFAASDAPQGSDGLGITGYYFRSSDLSGTPQARVDREINFDWGDRPPMDGFDNDRFSVRWVGEVEGPSTGKYTFYIVSNDGGRLWVDEKLLIDQWRGQTATEGRAEVDLAAGRRYRLRFEYFQNGGTALAKMLWHGPNVAKEIIPHSRLHTGGGDEGPNEDQGLLGSYFEGKEMKGTPKHRIDRRIDFDWKTGSPMEGIKPDRFSVRWLGRLKPPKDDSYTFTVSTDDGVRLWLDQELLIDEWHGGVVERNSRPITLKAGVEYELQMDYYEESASAFVKLAWSSPSMSRNLVSPEHLKAALPEEAQTTLLLDQRELPAGFVLNDGTVVGRHVHSADATSLKLSSSAKSPTIPTASVSWILFQRLSQGAAASLETGRTGLLMANGDFVDGEFRGLEPNQVSISSVLFGLQRYGRDKLRALVLRDPRYATTRFEVRSRDGSVFRVNDFQVQDQAVVFDSPQLDGVRIAGHELVEVRQLQGR